MSLLYTRRPASARSRLIILTLVLTFAFLLLGGRTQRTSPQLFGRAERCEKPVPLASSGDRVLVTGVAGFIASHVARHCAEKLGMVVIGVDDMSGGFDYNIPSGITFVKGDLKDPKFVSELFKKHGPFKYVYHLGAYAAEGLSHFIRTFNYENNLVASASVLNHAVNSGTAVYVFTSSIAVYGAGRTPMTEDMTPMPEDPYGVSKYAMELDLKAAHEMFGIDYVIFRPHNVYGPGQNVADRYRNVIGIFMRQALANEEMTIFGDGMQTRAFSHIDDVAPYIAESPLIKGARNQVFNVGADKPYTLNELASAVSHAMNVPVRVRHLPRRNEVDHAEASHDKLRCVFGARSPVTLDDGLRNMAEWVQRLKHRFEPVVFSNIEVRKNMPPSWNIQSHTATTNSQERQSKSRTNSLERQSKSPRIFYFGVTHHTSIERAMAADMTWGRRVMPQGFPWYSDQPDPRMLNLTVIVPPQGASYDMLYHRTKLIWKDVWQKYPGFDWYVRTWDDNFVFQERMQELATKYNPNTLIEIGRLGQASDGKDFVDGGGTSLVSRALLEKFIAHESSWPTEIVQQEDVTISLTRVRLGARLVRELGFHHLAPRPANSMPVSLSVYPSDISCRRPVWENAGEPAVVPYTYHYVSAAGMFIIERAWYETPCEAALQRAEEMKMWGPGAIGGVA